MSKIKHEIIEIVKSFTETEIRAYQRWIYNQKGETSHYVNFFNLIRKGQSIESLQKEFSSKNFSRIMAYLKESIHEFLIYYESNADLPLIKVQKQIILASKLKNRNLINQAIACLLKILSVAKKYHYFEQIFLILRRLSDSYNYINQSKLASNYLNELQETQKIYIQYITCQQDLIFIKSIYREFWVGYSKVLLDPILITKFIKRNKKNTKSNYKNLAQRSIY